MNSDMIRPKNQTKYLVLSIGKNCETLIKQTHTQPQETLKFKINQPRAIFSFKLSISIDGCWTWD